LPIDTSPIENIVKKTDEVAKEEMRQGFVVIVSEVLFIKRPKLRNASN